jgi:uncharacterized repeat protein (TIGR02543 family)
MTSNKTVTANFKKVSTYTLTVHIAPPQGGSVTKNPDKPAYDPNETVILTAIPNPGYVFWKWSGHASGSSNPLTITMNSKKEVTAHFCKANPCKKCPVNCEDEN